MFTHTATVMPFTAAANAWRRLSSRCSSFPARTTCSRGKRSERVYRWRCQNGYVPPIVLRAPSQARCPA